MDTLTTSMLPSSFSGRYTAPSNVIREYSSETSMSHNQVVLHQMRRRCRYVFLIFDHDNGNPRVVPDVYSLVLLCNGETLSSVFTFPLLLRACRGLWYLEESSLLTLKRLSNMSDGKL